MKTTIAVALAFLCSLIPAPAMADGAGPFSCYGGGSDYRNTCPGACPVQNGGYCEGKQQGATCGVEKDGTCEDLESYRSACPELMPPDAGQQSTLADAAGAALYCLKQVTCYQEVGGCNIGSDAPRRGRLVALPALLFFGGVFMLAVDRHRRRRARR
jgi:hypothetical protein